MLKTLNIATALGLMVLVVLAGCGGSTKSVNTPEEPAPENPFEVFSIGTDSTLEIATWNVEHFAKAGNVTADHVAEVILGIGLDVVALQEIESTSAFQRVLDNLEGYAGYLADGASGDLNLAYIYRTDGLLEITSIYEILTGESRALPRRPLVLEGRLGGEPFAIINNHFKCCGDGLLDEDESWDEETRRRDACLLLDGYVDEHFSGYEVVIVGDMNDELIDVAPHNVFQNFLDQTDQWRFTDLVIAEDESAVWSFPTWPSHIDHILINNHLFPDFLASEAFVGVAPLYSVLDGGWSSYDNQISDHLPVVVKLYPGD